ncbi:glycosyltransferase 87 family protein [Nocardioides sp. Root151]|uniref:glycosyltransferase 87 family protein n=1 Tax=Nocardioides sp. Root151 TaxID=1736475 RepID=UPI000703B566|nr:glycosyltransferase 87 family protein [Nocardioides sp. Root151]KQZ66921.1 hypothetical protein ASD66_18080 [Nocardioides sp. Root151]
MTARSGLGVQQRRSLVLVGSLAWLAGMVAMVAAEHGGFVDLAVYRFGGLSVLDDLPLYELGEAGTGLPFTYPPFAALLMTGPALLPFPLAVGLWTSISVLALAVTITLLLASHGRPRSSYVVPGLVLGALAFEPIWANLLFGQVNLLLMAAILVDLLGPGRRWSGALIGLVAGIKLTPLVFVVFLVLIGRRHQAAIAGLTFLVTVALGFALLPLASSAYWSHVLWDPGRVGGVPYSSNQSVLGGLTRLAGGEPSTAVWFLVAGAIAGPVLLLAARTWRRGDPALATCVAAMAMLLASPISWSHHWAWAVPTAIVLARSGRRWAAASWSLVFVSGCIWWPPHRDDLELAWSPLQQAVGNAYLWAALALVLLLARTRAAVRTEASEPVGVER